MYSSINDYSDVSTKCLAEDIACGLHLEANALVVYNLGLDDYIYCNIGQVLTLPVPDDIDNPDGQWVNTNHFVLVAREPQLNRITTPEIPYPFYMIVPYNCPNLHAVIK